MAQPRKGARVHHEGEHLQMARRHVAEAERRVDRQRDLIERLKTGGHPTTLAAQLLQLLLETTDQMRAHRDYLEAQVLKG